MYVLAGEGTFYLTRGVDHTIGKKPDCSVLLKAEVKHGISRLVRTPIGSTTIVSVASPFVSSIF